MRAFSTILLSLLLLASPAMAQEPETITEPSDAPPVAFPPLDHFSALWQRSLFTTREIPLPESDDGPNFTDQLSLAGVYEVDGAVAAVIVDKTTSLVSEVRIGSENEHGIRIKQVETGALPSSTRIQLLKNGQLGWISFDEVVSAPAAKSAPPPGTTVRPAIQIRPAGRGPAQAPPPVTSRSITPPVDNSAAPISDIPLPPE